MMTELINLFIPITSVANIPGEFVDSERISVILANSGFFNGLIRSLLPDFNLGFYVFLLLAATLVTTARNKLAIVLCWLVPGLGYARIGEKTRGILIFAGMALLWVSGLLIGGVDAVDSKEDRLWFAAQSGSGPIAFIVSAVNEQVLKTGSVGSMLDKPNGRKNTAGPRQLNSFKSVGRNNEYGILFTALAGLMNLVSLIDVGFRAPAQERTREGDGS